ncbi:hypothetical protein BCR42DRAFT_416519 [Absidia repens]|uniref:F-box domain-containing protein n=1 Tax=Absidia repens TaxID=90262 RepID=A0A1X2IEQ8_9FUNG|nr:hypothetical protein BCR42DRAFT_416519 [Absidia repens]
MYLQQLPPEIIYHILYFLPSTDITEMASVSCQSIRQWSLVLLNERAQQSMLEGWRLMIGATTTKPETENGGTNYEKDQEYICAFDYIDMNTMDLYFSVGGSGDEEFGSIANITSETEMAIVPSSSTSPPPEPQLQDQQKQNQACIPMSFGGTTTTVQVSILKERVLTKLLEFAATLSDNYSFLVAADNYQSLEPTRRISLSAQVHPEFTINYHIQRLSPANDHDRSSDELTTPTTMTTTTTTTTIPLPRSLSQRETRTDSPITPPSPPSQNIGDAKPDILLCIDSLKVAPKWWWTRIDQHRYSTFLGLEHQYW